MNHIRTHNEFDDSPMFPQWHHEAGVCSFVWQLLHPLGVKMGVTSGTSTTGSIIAPSRTDVSSLLFHLVQLRFVFIHYINNKELVDSSWRCFPLWTLTVIKLLVLLKCFAWFLWLVPAAFCSWDWHPRALGCRYTCSYDCLLPVDSLKSSSLSSPLGAQQHSISPSVTLDCGMSSKLHSASVSPRRIRPITSVSRCRPHWHLSSSHISQVNAGHKGDYSMGRLCIQPDSGAASSALHRHPVSNG